MDVIHINSLREHLENLGGDAASPVKSAVTAALGGAARVIENMRTDPVSKNLRDDYTALNLAASYLKDYTSLITEINEIIPQVMVSEPRDEAEVLDPGPAERAVEGTQQAWRGKHLHNGHSHAW